MVAAILLIAVTDLGNADTLAVIAAVNANLKL